ncbi:hypothetical protein HG263_04830 [Pseudoalteromonas sp. JBTF-M23]|uniref:YcaO domain-containing protein n=1 Tax=Pseudoalteromonas caenipelagi TaxID=2726988 RepID=A0A849V8G8_9GAMM|nr:YcaO-like family protein [Pseudoalteromonas caenipelagi]NOU49859.1 hypothetical protein [Pseudoalteromonas caenipelagi]
MKYSLNKTLTFYIVKNAILVISSFYKDDALDCNISVKLVKLLAKSSLTLEQILSEINAPPALVLRKFNILKNAGVIESTQTAENAVSNFETKHAISQSYFHQLVLDSPLGKNETLKCSDGKVVLFLDLATSCSVCSIKRILSLRPLLSLVRMNKNNVQAILPDTIEVKIQAISIKKDSVLEVDIKTSQCASYPIIHHSICKFAANNYTPSHLNHSIDKALYSPLRFRSASQTLELLSPLINKYTGIINSLTHYGKTDSKHIHNYTAGINTAFSPQSLSWVSAGLRSANGGKGTTKEQAKCSAICEAIERYSMLHHERKYDSFAKPDELELSYVLPSQILLFSESQLNKRSEQNRNNTSPQHWIPKSFDMNQPYHWCKTLSLTSNEPVYVPAEVVYAQFQLVEDSQRISMPDSNGCASGNTLNEAILHGALELIERDAIAIWWYNKIPRHHIQIASIDSEYVKNIHNEFEGSARTLNIIEITSDISVPVYVAVSYNKSTKTEVLYGFGCHVDPLVAIERAVSEVCQLVPAIANSQTQRSEPEFYDWLHKQEVGMHPHLDVEKLPTQDFSPSNKAYSLEEALLEVINKLKQCNQELLIFDLTMSDTMFPVVRVLSPGLRHFWRRLAPGRLYNVPVKMGWIEQEYEESELNKYNITI